MASRTCRPKGLRTTRCQVSARSMRRGGAHRPPAKAEPVLLTTDNPFQFEAKVVHKTGDHYAIHGGRVTNCDPKNPWWTLRASKSGSRPRDIGCRTERHAPLERCSTAVRPVLPQVVEAHARQSGFLTPTLGNSSRFGRILGQSYYWAINRSYDATFGGTYYTARGFASTASLRGRPTKNSSFDAAFFDMRDRGRKRDDGSRLKQGGNSFDLKGQAMFGKGWRGVADLPLPEFARVPAGFHAVLRRSGVLADPFDRIPDQELLDLLLQRIAAAQRALPERLSGRQHRHSQTARHRIQQPHARTDPRQGTRLVQFRLVPRSDQPNPAQLPDAPLRATRHVLPAHLQPSLVQGLHGDTDAGGGRCRIRATARGHPTVGARTCTGARARSRSTWRPRPWSASSTGQAGWAIA